MTQSIKQSNRVLLAKLLATSVMMFLFALYVMPPLYNLFCEVTGLNGKTGGQYQATEVVVDTSRVVKVQFLATNNESMPWGFKPEVQSMEVHPGQEVEVRYLAFNPTGETMVAQAVPSVVPFKAAEYFHKTECFCFNQQPLDGGENAELPLRFIVDQDVPKQVHTITLSYTLFDITDKIELASTSP
ncbi:cytochrome c oxidase assembly protein [Pseudomaricurvus alkylphenolicus]|jgi:cytochrome c oxidase assembly protein subunit 11|uniref:cytochrome c oxidase assembly protein n=1 Tax=Pseudomaricurvus alkylphenolicus TaxID=1306991 RepID=UPI0014233327|nr:cytochrome c oxidase assembly protein [Pseudomaricurvus alkylphenolicus]NIB39523.1 cytochrome c oxidase assembly protein [Pseudomaricurvus alkylphenolicus]